MPRTPTERLTPTETILLQVIQASPDKRAYPAQILRGSQGDLKEGTLYVILGRLKKQAILDAQRVKITTTQGPRVCIYYSLTKKGVEMLRVEEEKIMARLQRFIWKKEITP